MLHSLRHGQSLLDTILSIRPFQLDITESLDLLICAKDNNRNGVVSLYHFQYEVQVHILFGLTQCTHRLGPHLHLVTLFNS